MNWFLTIIFVQLVFDIVLSIPPVIVNVGSAAALGGGYRSFHYSDTIGKNVIQSFISEDVMPIDTVENILKIARVVDLIAVDRQGLLFNHWATLIKNGRVANPYVHEAIKTREIYNTTRALILGQNLKNGVGRDLCRVNKKPRSSKKRGIKSRTEEDILEYVEKMLSTGVDYNMCESNCEHRVTEVKFGVAFSDQVIVFEKKM
jgi:hypothetical protein